jgi:3-oxoacyl-[acyl-carrier protein] reductase
VDLNIEGKCALVSGAGGGLGGAIARALAAEGANVVVNDVDRDVAQTVVDEIVAGGGAAVASAHDVGSWSGAEGEHAWVGWTARSRW